MTPDQRAEAVLAVLRDTDPSSAFAVVKAAIIADRRELLEEVERRVREVSHGPYGSIAAGAVREFTS